MDFFKKLFVRAPKEITIDQIELKDWLEGISKASMSQETSQIKESFAKIEDYKKELKSKLHTLEIAELINKNIPERERHIMIGNRHNYLSKSYAFLAGLTKPEMNHSKIQDYCDRFFERLEQLNDDTGKGYFVLKNFFEHEMRDIAVSIKKLEEEFIRIDTILNSEKNSEISGLFAKIRELNESYIESEKLTSEISGLEHDLYENMQRRASFENKIVSLKEGADYKTYHKVLKEKKDIEADIENLNFKLNNVIKQFDKILKKLMHESIDEDIISKYLESPLDALEHDDGLKIIGLLQKAKENIDSLGLKEKDQEKLQKAAESFTKEYLSSVKREYGRLLTEKKTISEVIEKSSIVMDYKELEYQLEHIDVKIKKIESDLRERKNILASLNPKKKSAALEQKLSDFSKIKVIIK